MYFPAQWDVNSRIQQLTERDIVIINLTKRTVQSVYFGTNVRLQKINKREITEHIWESYKDIARENKRTKTGKELYKTRKFTIERSFADSKELHGFRYARIRGVKSVQEQSYLTAACQNMKNSPPSKEKGSRWRFFGCMPYAFKEKVIIGA
jgi:ABC-type ATPase with predicted acetyltransferase domain